MVSSLSSSAPGVSVKNVFDEQQTFCKACITALPPVNILACVGLSERVVKRASNMSSEVRTTTRPSVARAPFGTTDMVKVAGAFMWMLSPGVFSS
jgi:hypothetical protein